MPCPTLADKTETFLLDMAINISIAVLKAFLIKASVIPAHVYQLSQRK